MADGLDRVDAYLDDAALAGMPFVHIIHGHGTGTLKREIRKWLRECGHIKSYRPGERFEGGDGATIVILRNPSEEND